MIILNIKQEKNTFTIYFEDKIYAEIVFNNYKNAVLKFDNKVLLVEEGPDKNMILKEHDISVFTFKFDYLWGGAEIIAGDVDTGYDIKGRWFKSGTRLINEDDLDLVIVKIKNDDLEALVLDDSLSKMMVVATIYYHIYASAGKFLQVIFTSAIS